MVTRPSTRKGAKNGLPPLGWFQLTGNTLLDPSGSLGSAKKSKGRFVALVLLPPCLPRRLSPVREGAGCPGTPERTKGHFTDLKRRSALQQLG